MPHKLELSDALKQAKTAATVLDIMELIYKTYHYSPKSRRELKNIPTELGSHARMPTRVKGTRWLPHVRRALGVMLNDSKGAKQYMVVYRHMEHIAAASTSTADVIGGAK